jgi:hypothetical protein
MKCSSMRSGASIAFALIRLPRGQRPSQEQLVDALDEDRRRLHLPPSNGSAELLTAGPYPIIVDGQELDEYVAWER